MTCPIYHDSHLKNAKLALNGETDRLSYAFYWSSSPQGSEYWSNRCEGKVPLSDEDRAYIAEQIRLYEIENGMVPTNPLPADDKSELDPLGKDAHQPGAKLDAGKNRLGLVLGGFARALEKVGEVGTYGANKYTDNGWLSVPNGEERYTDAMLRHLVKNLAGKKFDDDTGIYEAAHVAWNALARLELELRADAVSFDDDTLQTCGPIEADDLKNEIVGHRHLHTSLEEPDDFQVGDKVVHVYENSGVGTVSSSQDKFGNFWVEWADARLVPVHRENLRHYKESSTSEKVDRIRGKK